MVLSLFLISTHLFLVPIQLAKFVKEYKYFQGGVENSYMKENVEKTQA